MICGDASHTAEKSGSPTSICLLCRLKIALKKEREQAKQLSKPPERPLRDCPS